MLKAFLAPYETEIWAVLVLLLITGGVFEIHHLEQIGVQRQQASDAKLAAAQQIRTAEVEKRAQEIVAANGNVLHAALIAPVDVAPITVRVCPNTPTAGRIVSENGSAVAGSPVVGNGSGPVGSTGASQAVDIAPDTEAILRRQDAEIAYWRSYYQACKTEGACQ